MHTKYRLAGIPALFLVIAACSSSSSSGAGGDSGPPEQDAPSGTDATPGQDATPMADSPSDSTVDSADAPGPEGGPSDGPIPDSGPAEACTATGGTVMTASCCRITNDFPDNCLVGACGCSPTNSHTVQTCDCGAGKCWDGTTCVPRG